MGWGAVEGPLLGLREPTFQIIEPLEKVPGGSRWCLNTILVFSLSLGQADQIINHHILEPALKFFWIS